MATSSPEASVVRRRLFSRNSYVNTSCAEIFSAVLILVFKVSMCDP
jgi:hypothetical protein